MTMNIVEILLIPFVLAVGIAALGFWLWMLIDCLTREPRENNGRLMWVLVIVLTKLVGAGIYYFVRHRKRAQLSTA